jgi:hypothetical protein
MGPSQLAIEFKATLFDEIKRIRIDSAIVRKEATMQLQDQNERLIGGLELITGHRS